MFSVNISDEVRDFLSRRLSTLDNLILDTAIAITPPKEGVITVTSETIQRIYQRAAAKAPEFIPGMKPIAHSGCTW